MYIYTGFLKGPQVRPMPQMSITSPVALTNIQALPKGRHSKTNRIKKKRRKNTLKEKKKYDIIQIQDPWQYPHSYPFLS